MSYHFGPGGATGAFRWTAMTKDLIARGWSFDVLTVDRPAWSSTAGDPSHPGDAPLEVFAVPDVTWPERAERGILELVRRIARRGRDGASPAGDAAPPDPAAIIARVEAWKPGDRASMRTRIAKAVASVQLLLSERLWARRAGAVARELLRHRTYSAVIVSSPPHVSQLVGVAVARSAGLPFIADYRDPWVLGLGVQESRVNIVSRTVGRRYELLTQAAASAIVHNTERAAQAIEALAPRTARLRLSIANGYDAVAQVDRPDPRVFRVLYGGWLHPYMDVRSLLAACARLRTRRALAAEEFRLELLGTGPQFGGVDLRDLASAYGLGDCTEILTRLPRDEALRRQQRAAVLAAFDYPHGIAVVMKFYEYAQMRGALLLIGNPEGALADAAGRLGVRVHAPGDTASLDRALDEALARWRADDWSAINDREGIFRRDARSAEMNDLLMRLTAS